MHYAFDYSYTWQYPSRNLSDDEDDDTAPQVQPTSQSEGRSGHDSDASSESLFQHNDDDAWDNLL